ncbi:MAG TPA: glycosyltransferase [Pyrinomonadaceae bacterium]
MKSKMKIVSVVEATTMNAVAKIVLEFHRTAREIGEASGDLPRIEGSFITFDRASDHQPGANEFVEATQAAGIEIDVIPERRRFDLAVVSALKEVVRQRQPDLVITHSVKSHFLMWRSRLWKQYPWIAFHHGYTSTDRKMKIYNRFDRWSLPKADLVITVCNAFALELGSVARVAPERIRVRHNSIRPVSPSTAEDVRALRERLGIVENEAVILSVGRLSKEKAHADLIKTFKQLRTTNPDLNCKLVIVGDGPEREPLASASAKSGLSQRIILAGQVTDVQPFYAMSDVFVLPSLTEGSPNVLLEAMAAQAPIVATAVGGVPEIVENEESALLVPANDPAALAAAIARLLTDAELGRRLTRNAGEIVSKNHSPEEYVRSLIAIYDEVVGTVR